jgi:hypothetical protein
VGKANRERRRAKLKDREQERKRRQHKRERGGAWKEAGGQPRGRPGSQPGSPGGWLPSQADAAEQLVAGAVHAQYEGDRDAFAWCVAQLATPDSSPAGPAGATAGGPGWQPIVARALWASLQQAVTSGWRQGWQPGEMVRQVERHFGAPQARLATDAVAAEMRAYAAATVDERWQAQMAALGAIVWWDRDDKYLDQWRDREHIGRQAAITCALETLFSLKVLPEMSRLCPLPGSATRGMLASERASERSADQRMLDRVRALLAKAESTEFPEEAEAYTARAQELMARHSIDEALLAAAARDRSGRPGEPSGRRLFVDSPYEAAKAVLLDVISGANRCRSIWHKNLGLCTVVGFPADLEAVELLFTSLLVQATTAMIAAGSRQDAWGRSRTRSFRRAFLASYAQRIGERLAGATSAAERQAVAESPGTRLLPVLAARHRVVDDAFDVMFPDQTMTSAGSINDREGWISGRAAADLATLHERHKLTGDAA